MRHTKFKIETGQQSPAINRMLKCADLADGAVIRDGSGYIVTVTWEKDQVVNTTHIQKVKGALQKAFEGLGFCVLGITAT